VISVIVYGRNDDHGYNLHRRVALSLNCLAEVLTDDADEIVFVDYNTRDQLPTLVEAIGDTLTERCLSAVRVVRVRERTHAQFFRDRTHLPIVEPVARNVGARHTNPANRWLLSTNTDMILLPLQDESLSEVCDRLPDGFYALPRFELPEWLWEKLPRTDPRRALAEIGRLGPGLSLDEITLSHDEIRFDAPGDFQLILRDDFFAIDGFDEEMLLGGHVEADVANDLHRFFHAIEYAEIPDQRRTWGLEGTSLEVVALGDRAGSDLAAAIIDVTANGAAGQRSSDARNAKFALEYDSNHALPFVADSLTISPSDARVAYVGANAVLEGMLVALVEKLEPRRPLMVPDLGSPESVTDVERDADLFVVDLGVDVSLVDKSLATDTGDVVAEVRAGLVRAFDALRLIVELERARLHTGAHPRPFVLVNSNAVYWDAFVSAELSSSASTPHSRVRRCVVRDVPDTSEAARTADVRALQLLRWITRGDSVKHRLHVLPGNEIHVADLDRYSGFGHGWAFPDQTGLWTQGPCSELAIALDGSSGPCHLTLTFDDVDVAAQGSISFDLLANGERIASSEFSRFGRDRRRRRSGQVLEPRRRMREAARALGLNRIRTLRWVYHRAVAARTRAHEVLRRKVERSGGPRMRWRVRVPSRAITDGMTDFMLVVREPVSWSDDRQRGLHLAAVEIRWS